jgi:uncharacterized membrane protein YhhN
MKEKLKFLFSIPYFILAALVIWVQISGMTNWENILKPSLLIILIWWFIVESRMFKQKLNILFLAALFFSLLGDIFLMPFFNVFILGLVFFLLSHLFYISVFLKGNYGFIRKILKQGAPYVIIVTSIYLSLLAYLIPSIIDLNSLILLIAVPVYASVLLIMVLSTFVYSKVNYNQFGQFVMMGGLFFLVSDGILAINKFGEKIDNSAFWVMGSYVIAQWMLVYGFRNVDRLKASSKQ